MSIDSTARRAILEFRSVSAHTNAGKLCCVSFTIYEGEYTAMVGADNSGYLAVAELLRAQAQCDAGEICLFGKPFHIKNGGAPCPDIAFISRHSALINSMSVAENLWLNRPGLRSFQLVNESTMYSQAKRIIEKYNLPLKPDMRVSDLSAATRTFIEMIKLAEMNTRLIVMQDVMTLATQEENELFAQLSARVLNRGCSILVLENQLLDVLESAERLYLFANSGQIQHMAISQNYMQQSFRAHLSRRIPDNAVESYRTDREILRVKNLSVGRLTDVSFCVHAGERVGIYVDRPEKEQLLYALAGAIKSYAGEILLDSRPVSVGSIAEAHRLGIGIIPPDINSLYFSDLSVKQNLEMNFHDRLSSLGILSSRRRHALQKDAERILASYRNEFHILGNNPAAVVLTRFALYPFRILIVLHPSASNDEIKQRMLSRMMDNMMKRGTGIIIASTRLRTLHETCDAVYEL